MACSNVELGTQKTRHKLTEIFAFRPYNMDAKCDGSTLEKMGFWRRARHMTSRELSVSLAHDIGLHGCAHAPAMPPTLNVPPSTCKAIHS